MDGIFVAFHNTKVIFGFEYLPLEEMEEYIFETKEMADISFKTCTSLLSIILKKIVEISGKYNCLFY